jgi:hypothetical protein
MYWEINIPGGGNKYKGLEQGHPGMFQRNSREASEAGVN